MKTIEAIDLKISEIKAKAGKDGKLYKKDASRLAFLRDIKVYIELTTKESIVKQQQQITQKLKIIKDRYEDWCNGAGIGMVNRGKRAHYNKEMGVYELNKYLRNVNFILSIYEEADKDYE